MTKVWRKKKKKASEVHNTYTFESNNQGRFEITDEWNEGKHEKTGDEGPGIEMRGKKEWESAVGSSGGGCN